VIVNRLWQHHFGRAIVATPSDFGSQGALPTHQELLDFLASELIRNGWHLKEIHRLILTSSAYRQSSELDSAKLKADPDNLLIWHHPRQRLEGEAIRDVMLSISGMMDATMFGPGSLDEGQKRRSIYFQIKRSQLIPMMSLFDGPDSLQGLPIRSTTTIAPQALALMNNSHVQEYAKGFAKRLLPQAEGSVAEAVKSGYLIALSRPVGADDLADAISFIETQAKSYRDAGHVDALELALADFCQAVMSLNEFIYIE